MPSGHDGINRFDRCRAHGLDEKHYLPQLRRLLYGRLTERRVYDSMVSDVVGSPDPLAVFHQSEPRPVVYFVEALYLAHAELAADDLVARPYLAPLGYSRWLAWRRFGDAIRSRRVLFDPRVAEFEACSRSSVIGHLGDGWRPQPGYNDSELDQLIVRYS